MTDRNTTPDVVTLWRAMRDEANPGYCDNCGDTLSTDCGGHNIAELFDGWADEDDMPWRCCDCLAELTGSNDCEVSR